MAENAVVYVLKELSAFLLTQSTNLGGELEREVQSIRDELGSMRAFLRDAEAKEHDVFELEEWIKQVREVAYDIEDVLDEFLLCFAHHRADGFYGRVRQAYYSIKNLTARRRISSEVKNLKSRVTDISDRHKRYHNIYGNQGALVANPDNDVHACAILAEETGLVGIDKPKSELISQILEGNSHRKVVAVVGMGGIGKTTLVRKVFDDTAVKRQFQIHAWLTISQTFQIRMVINNLIQQMFDEINEPVPPQVAESMDVIKLSKFIKEFLQHRRYILVLDDVWTVASWEALKDLLPDGNHDGRVLLTTRIYPVASVACLEPHNYVHQMKPLSDVKSWTLFRNRAFQGNLCPPHLEEVSARILKKCEGLPLAIEAIGGVLALKDKDKVEEWEMIFRDLGGELECGRKFDHIKRILQLSYNDLPHHLKSCFLYLSIYPEDEKIYIGDMLEKWIAQGFVEEKEGMSYFDTAIRYANELVNRSLLQVETRFVDGTFEYFRVHDFLRDMIVSKSCEQNFIAIAKGNYNRTRSNRVRRLAIHDFIDNPHPQELNKDCLRGLRSLEFFGYQGHMFLALVSSFLCRGSKLIKVLDLTEVPLEDIPRGIFKLFYLKYLSLQSTGIRTLPKSIGKLENLEFLDLSDTEVTEMPVQILKLTKLRSLYVGQTGDYKEDYGMCGCKSPDGIGTLLDLEKLHAIDADNAKIVKEIGKLTKLRRLTMTKLRREDGKEFLRSLVKLTNLRELSVYSFKEDETLDLQYPMSPAPRVLKWLLLQGNIEKIPQWVTSLHSLTIMVLQDSGLKKDNNATGGGIESLQDLPNLVELTLIHAYEGDTLLFRAGGFQKLKELYIERLERLKWVRAEDDGSLPSLQLLSMRDCKRVEELPLSVTNLRKLKSLKLRDMCDELVKKVLNLDQQSEEYRAISCIPDFQLRYWKDGKWYSYLA